jgi:uncharacterized surface protein with fasciclin (FAS1) repeats
MRRILGLTFGTVFLGLVTACSSIATPPALLTQGPQQNKPEATAVTPEPTQSAEMMEQDIVDVAVEDGRFTTLATALEAANLVDTLKSQEPFTVFAPTDEAFGRLPEGPVEGLLEGTPH